MSEIEKALVTGAGGFLGSALCRELASRGAEVIALVRSEAPELSEIGEVRTIVCDMADYGRLGALISDRDIDAFFHFAWRGASGPRQADRELQIRNISDTCDAVTGCVALGCKRFVYASSLGESEVLTLMHSERKLSINMLYHSAKLAANLMASATAARYGVDYLQGKISNAYGPGECSQRLISSSLRRLARGERCPFTSGNQMYDFIYITDAARAFIDIAEHGVPNRCYYIGSGRPRPLKEFLLAMGDIVSKQDKIGLGDLPFTAESLDYETLDMGALARDAGFLPQVDFITGIRATYNWIVQTQSYEER